MHFVKKSNCPKILELQKDNWTNPWTLYYGQQTFCGPLQKRLTKPSDSHWLKEEIRLLLINDFHENCGYCGSHIATPWSESDKEEVVGKGDVDHFLAKAVYPSLTYDWNNYIWSCKPCNQLKGEFDDLIYPLLSPCLVDDCNTLTFVEETGLYALKPRAVTELIWKNRLYNNNIKTLLNSEGIKIKRRDIISLLLGRFNSISMALDNIKKLEGLNGELGEVRIGLVKQTNADKIEILKTLVPHPEFHLLIKERYELLRISNPLVAAFLDE